MGFWNSLQTVVDRVAGTAANISLAMESDYLVPGQTSSFKVVVKNGNSELAVRAVVLEIRAIEEINLPRSADMMNVLEDFAQELEDAASSSPSKTQSKKTTVTPLNSDEVSRHSDPTIKLKYTVATGLNLSPGEECEFKANVSLPDRAQPTYTGKYAKHHWQARAHLDVLGVDPATNWIAFRVGTKVK